MIGTASQKLALLGILSALAGSARAGFAYQANDVVFDGGVFGIVSGNFSVIERAISSGQDPSNINQPGDVHVLDPSSKSLTFTVGRHKTSEVADFWNGYLNPSQTSVNDKPGSLNFAFYGDLVIQLANPSRTAYIRNLLLGQGSYADSQLGTGSTVSNWWFGGLSCAYIGSYTARCSGSDSTGLPLTLDFKHQEGAEILTVGTAYQKVANRIYLVGVH